MEKLANTAGHSADFSGTSARERMAVNLQKSQGSDIAVSLGGVNFLGKTHVVPEAVIDKMQAYSIPKNMKEVQACGGVGGFWNTFIPH